MKKLKLIMALIAVPFSINLLFAVKPLTGDANNFANKKLMQLSNVINLTDSQKTIIKIKAKEFGIKILNKDSISYSQILPIAMHQYKIETDSILTIEQKTQLFQKRMERKNAAISKYKNKSATQK